MNKPEKKEHKKTIGGHFCVTFEMPIEYDVDAIWEEYEDGLGNSYFEEDYEGSIDQCVEQNPKITELLNKAKEMGWKMTEMVID